MSAPVPDLLDPADLGPLDEVDAIAYATGMVRTFCGWHIAPSVTETRSFDGDGTPVLLLPTLHLSDVGAVTTTADGGAVSVAWGENGVLWRSDARQQPLLDDLSRGTWLRLNAFPAGLRTVTVTYTHGYDETPPAVASVVAAIARRLLGGGAGIPVIQEQAGDVMRMYGGGLGRSAQAFTAVESMVLDRFRLPLAA